MSETTDLLARLIRIETCDPPGGEMKIARMVQNYLHDRQIDAELDEFQTGRANVLARLKGTGNRPGLIFSAHFDTVPVAAALGSHIGDDIEIEWIDYKPPVETAPDHPFVEACVKACRHVTGLATVPAGVSYYSDATVICPALDLPMVILGPGELGMSGQTDEFVELAKLEQAVPIFEQIARSMLTD